MRTSASSAGETATDCRGWPTGGQPNRISLNPVAMLRFLLNLPPLPVFVIGFSSPLVFGAVNHMRVDVGGSPDRSMAQTLGHRGERNPLREQRARVRMP